MLRRLYHDQPESFAFTPENRKWAEAQMTKFPEGRQASAIIPLLWRAQEQEGWLSRPAIEHVADMLGLAHIRALEVATFYFMFQLQPVGSVAHVQICGTTSCMICGAEDLVAVCKDKIARRPHALSEDGKFSWEEVECLGACANAPMAQIGKDYYEDLTAERLGEIIDELAAGKVPVPGPQNGRYASEPLEGLTSLEGYEETGHTKYNASVQLATDLGDTVKRIDGTEAPLTTPWLGKPDGPNGRPRPKSPRPSEGEPADETGIDVREAKAKEKGRPKRGKNAAEAETGKAKPDHHARAGSAADVEDKPAEGDTGDMRKGGEKRTGSAKKRGGEPSGAKAGATPTGAKEGTQGGTAEADAGEKPRTLDGPRGGKADDLKMIKGVGPKLEGVLHDQGIYHFDQIAAWSAAEVAWADQNLVGFKGRVSRDDWVEQARKLAAGEQTEFSKRAKYD